MELSLQTLETRRRRYGLIQTFKILKGFDCVDSSIWFKTVGNEPSRQTRQSAHHLNPVRRSTRTDVRSNFSQTGLLNPGIDCQLNWKEQDCKIILGLQRCYKWPHCSFYYNPSWISRSQLEVWSKYNNVQGKHFTHQLDLCKWLIYWYLNANEDNTDLRSSTLCARATSKFSVSGSRFDMLMLLRVEVPSIGFKGRFSSSSSSSALPIFLIIIKGTIVYWTWHSKKEAGV